MPTGGWIGRYSKSPGVIKKLSKDLCQQKADSYNLHSLVMNSLLASTVPHDALLVPPTTRPWANLVKTVSPTTPGKCATNISTSSRIFPSTNGAAEMNTTAST